MPHKVHSIPSPQAGHKPQNFISSQPASLPWANMPGPRGQAVIWLQLPDTATKAEHILQLRQMHTTHHMQMLRGVYSAESCKDLLVLSDHTWTGRAQQLSKPNYFPLTEGSLVSMQQALSSYEAKHCEYIPVLIRRGLPTRQVLDKHAVKRQFCSFSSTELQPLDGICVLEQLRRKHQLHRVLFITAFK